MSPKAPLYELSGASRLWHLGERVVTRGTPLRFVGPFCRSWRFFAARGASLPLVAPLCRPWRPGRYNL
uniref:Uncharacterized protein n=1 Tax=Papilio polytes TaxID=76194 RepID=I4DSE3_PAPPL|nr:unknown unsecreted protein [Papilio polytes]